MDAMTIDDLLADIDLKAKGRTRYKGQTPYRDETLAAEIRRLRGDLDEANRELDARQTELDAAWKEDTEAQARVAVLEGLLEPVQQMLDEVEDGDGFTEGTHAAVAKALKAALTASPSTLMEVMDAARAVVEPLKGKMTAARLSDLERLRDALDILDMMKPLQTLDAVAAHRKETGREQ